MDTDLKTMTDLELIDELGQLFTALLQIPNIQARLAEINAEVNRRKQAVLESPSPSE